MLIARRIVELRTQLAAVRAAGRAIAVVPTMGALHAGHVALIEAARGGLRDDGPAANAASPPFVVVTIFVNPAQFAPDEDFARYPRDEAGDLRCCQTAGADAVFLPEADEMHPPGARTSVRVAGLTDSLCGPFRPGHFDAVATVVAGLLNITQPDVAYFGRKDAQQLGVVRRLVRDLHLNVEIVGCPTVREPDGLALSSRNRNLTSAERRQALCLIEALREAERRIGAGQREVRPIVDAMRSIIGAAGASRIDYVSIVDAGTLAPVERIESTVLVALAVHFGTTRLIDNLTVDPRAGGG